MKEGIAQAKMRIKTNMQNIPLWNPEFVDDSDPASLPTHFPLLYASYQPGTLCKCH